MVALDSFAEVVKVTIYTGQWNAEIARYSPRATRRIWKTASESTVLVLPDFAWSSIFLPLGRNFLNHLTTVLWPTASSPFAKQMFCFFFGCFSGLMVQFELVKHKFLNWSMLHVYLYGFQITFEVKQCTTCQRTITLLPTTFEQLLSRVIRAINSSFIVTLLSRPNNMRYCIFPNSTTLKHCDQNINITVNSSSSTNSLLVEEWWCLMDRLNVRSHLNLQHFQFSICSL